MDGAEEVAGLYASIADFGTFWVPFAAYFFGLLLSYFFGLVVVATENYSSSKIEEMLEKADERIRNRALYFDKMWKDILTTAIFCRMATNIVVFYPLFFAEYRPNSTFGLVALVIGLLLLLFLFGHVLPNVYAKRGEEALFLRFAPLLNALSYPLYPLVKIQLISDHIVGKFTGRRPEGSDSLTEEEILDVVSDGELEGVIEEQELEMIENIFKFDDVPVSEVMTPRSKTVVIAGNAPLKEAATLALDVGHSRIPVYFNDKENVVGVLYVKDILEYWGDESASTMTVKQIMRDAFYVPETKKISELFKEFKTQHVHFAVVLDEYGGTSGVVTIEDILEVIVGDIEDEYDTNADVQIVRLSADIYNIDAKVEIEDINERLDTSLPISEKYATLGGLMLDVLGKIPITGESIVVANCKLTVLESSAKNIRRISLELIRPEEDEELDGD